MKPRFLILKSASHRIEQIYDYSVENWGVAQANKYIEGLFDLFERISNNSVLWKTIPAEFEVSGYYTRYEQHFVFWKELSDGRVGFAAVLHDRMNLEERLKDEF
ncbi:type II toxin-antitoxin system RelE/ParE family toxin [Alphaproteobacteria bacterium]|jgi:toxin ParE1/3/4|nr:type II toxin-antitoxin system RelE/ParE family toxin [Alphaproteobacteria bacterium]